MRLVRTDFPTPGARPDDRHTKAKPLPWEFDLVGDECPGGGSSLDEHDPAQGAPAGYHPRGTRPPAQPSARPPRARPREGGSANERV